MTEIWEAENKVGAEFEDAETPLRFDVLLGAYGIHSAPPPLG